MTFIYTPSSIPLRIPFAPNRGFNFTKPIRVTNRTTKLTNYQIEVNLNTTNFAFEKARPDGADIRFQDANGKALSYWIESWLATSAKIWVKLDELEAYEDRIIWLIYGNYDGANESSGDNTFTFFDDFRGIDAYAGFTFQQRWNLDHYGHQGVAFDGTYIYSTGKSTNKELAKFNLASVKQAEDTLAADKGTAMNQINHIEIYNGKLYVGSSNFNTEPKQSYIKVFNCNDLSYVEEHQVKDYWCDGCAFHNNAWWVVYTDWQYVSKYDTSWNWIADYALSYTITGTHKYQGIMWIDDYIFVNIHGGSTPTTCDVYEWNGSGFDEVKRLDRVDSHDTQGIFYDGEHMWWAERDYYESVQGAISKTTVDTEKIIDPSKWIDTYGDDSASIVDGKLRITTDGATAHPDVLQGQFTVDYQFMLVVTGYPAYDDTNFYFKYYRPDTEESDSCFGGGAGASSGQFAYKDDAGWHDIQAYSVGQKYKIEHKIPASKTDWDIWIDGIEKATNIDFIASGKALGGLVDFGFYHGVDGHYCDWDNVFVRKYNSLEPLVEIL